VYSNSMTNSTINQFGQKIKLLRESKSLLQKHLAYSLQIDTPLYSKIERGERSAKREQVLVIAKTLEVDKNELLIIWLADKILDLIDNDEVAIRALKEAEKHLKK
jgi:transcriptional regulator with XRE-family HTH domain